jgi:DNA (cytosine-5)-methyltransferase 1
MTTDYEQLTFELPPEAVPIRRGGPRVLEGFGGAGGLSDGARLAGASDVLGVEINRDACATATAAGHARVRADVRDVDPARFTRTVGWISATPCPTFTEAGKQAGLVDYELVLEGVERLGDCHVAERGDRGWEGYLATYRKVSDERTALVLETLRVALLLPNLRWLVAEQVPAVHGIWELMGSVLASSHYFRTADVITVRASDLGAATRRERVFLVASRARDLGPALARLPLRQWWHCGRFAAPQLREADPAASPFPATSMARALGWPAGVRVNTRGARTTPGGNEFSADGPAVSMTGNGTRTWYRTDLGKPDGLLTDAQAGLCQGFPADYPWQGSRTSRFQQIADTVSPLVGAAVVGAVAGYDWQPAVRRRLGEAYGHRPPAADMPAAAGLATAA